MFHTWKCTGMSQKAKDKENKVQTRLFSLFDRCQHSISPLFQRDLLPDRCWAVDECTLPSISWSEKRHWPHRSTGLQCWRSIWGAVKCIQTAVVWSKTSPLAQVICTAALFFLKPISPSDNPQTQSGPPCAPRGEIELPFISYKHHVQRTVVFFVSAFQTLTLAKKYALDKAKPFPEIDDQIKKEKDWPKDCYVFEGKEKEPTIIYMPLFNRANCRGLFPFPPSDSPVLLQWAWFPESFFLWICPWWSYISDCCVSRLQNNEILISIFRKLSSFWLFL